MKNTLYKPKKCLLCESSNHELVKIFHTPPNGENTFGLTNYYRELWLCRNCGLFSNKHQMDLAGVYQSSYREAAYGGDQMRKRYEKIMALPPEESDNRQRVHRVISYMTTRSIGEERKVLDVGSGMAVFPAAMREAGWKALVVDPDANNVNHARSVAKVDGIQGSFPNVEIDGTYPLITFNKVLEHIQEIVECLSGAHRYLTKDGIVYIELPDGESAFEKGPTRQEFFLEHFYIFSAASIALLTARAGFRLQLLERIRDPSGKYTLVAFLARHRIAEGGSGIGHGSE